MRFDLAFPRRSGATGLLAIAAAGLAVVVWTTVFERRAQPASTVQASDADSAALYLCIDHTMQAIKPSDLDYASYERIWRLCGNQVYNQTYLADFTIRREQFVRQLLDERVTLWMVVSITVSGVVLAGLQLLTSYKLASSGHVDVARDSEVVIQRDRISLKSSITGVLILGISLAFFIVYVLGIYTIKEMPVDRPQNLQPATAVVSTVDGLGPPPADPPAEMHNSRATVSPADGVSAKDSDVRVPGIKRPNISARPRERGDGDHSLTPPAVSPRTR
jgi:hypothetical protein